MADETGALKPVGGGGRSFLGVRRIEPQDDGVHLYGEDGEVARVEYGEKVYVNGRVMEFVRRKSADGS